MIELKSPFTTVRDRLIAMPRVWQGLVVLVIVVGFFFTTPFLLWSYNIERAGRLLDRGLIWAEPRQSDSLPQLGNPAALKTAEEYLAAAIYWRPTHPYAYRLSAYTHIAQGDWEGAVKSYEQAEKLAPRHPLLTWEKALVYEQLWQEGTTSAHPALTRTWAELNLDAAAFQARAREASSAGKREDSLRWYVRALQLGANVESGVAYGHYVLLQKQGDESAAQARLEEAISYDTGWLSAIERFQAWSRWARLLFDGKQYSQAEAALQQAIAVFPEQASFKDIFSENYRFLGLTQLELAKPEAALESFQKAFEIDHQNTWAIVNYGQLLYELEPTKTAQSSQAFETALRLKSDDVQLWEDLILYWRRAQEMEQVDVLCQLAATEQVAAEVAELCQTGQALASDWYYQSQALSEEGKIEQATEALQQAITLDEGWFSAFDRFQAWSQWGRLLFDDKRYAEAEEALQLALSEKKEQIDNSLLSASYRYLALTQLELAKREAALENLAQAIDLDNQNLWAYVSYGQLLYELQPTHTAQASQAFETALRLESDDLQLWQTLILYWRRAQEMEQVEALCQLAATEQRAADVAELCQVGAGASSDLYYQYLALLGEDKQSDASAALEQAISLDEGWFSSTDRFQAWYQWGRWLSEQKRYPEAEKAYQTAIDSASKEVENSLLSQSYRYLALTQIELGKQNVALDNFQQAIESDNQNLWAYVSYGQLLYELEPTQASSATESFKSALALSPDNVQLWQDLILFWRREREIEQANLLCEAAEGTKIVTDIAELCQVGDEASSDLYYQYLALLAEDKESDAFAALERAISLDEGWFSPVDRFRAWSQWGMRLVKQKEYAEAERVLNEAVSRYPEEAGFESFISENYRFMGMSQAYQGKRNKAFESFEQSIQWDENNVWSMLNYGQLLYKLEPQRVSETDDAFAKVLTLKENDPNVWRSLIGFWLNQAEEERAAMLCQQAAEKEFAEELSDICQ